MSCIAVQKQVQLLTLLLCVTCSFHRLYKTPKFLKGHCEAMGASDHHYLSGAQNSNPPQNGQNFIAWGRAVMKNSQRDTKTESRAWVSLLRQVPELFYGSSTVCLHTVSCFQVSLLQGWGVTGAANETCSSALARIYSLRCACSQTVTRPFLKHVFYFKLPLVNISMITMN